MEPSWFPTAVAARMDRPRGTVAVAVAAAAAAAAAAAVAAAAATPARARAQPRAAVVARWPGPSPTRRGRWGSCCCLRFAAADLGHGIDDLDVGPAAVVVRAHRVVAVDRQARRLGARDAMDARIEPAGDLVVAPAADGADGARVAARWKLAASVEHDAGRGGQRNHHEVVLEGR